MSDHYEGRSEPLTRAEKESLRADRDELGRLRGLLRRGFAFAANCEADPEQPQAFREKAIAWREEVAAAIVGAAVQPAAARIPHECIHGLPLDLFCGQCPAETQPAAAQEWEPPPPTVLTDEECDHIADFMERREWQGIGKDDVRLWAKAFDELPYLRATDNSSASDQPAAGGLQSPASEGADT